MNVQMCGTEDEARAAIEEFTLDFERSEKPNSWETWVFGLTMVTATAFSSEIAIFGTPFISKLIYNRLLTFLLAFGAGNISGCTFFVLFPRSMHISELGTADYIIKTWLALGGCYLLFVFEKLMDFVGEMKKERKIKTAQVRRTLMEQQMPREATYKEQPRAANNVLESAPPGIIVDDIMAMPQTPSATAQTIVPKRTLLTPRKNRRTIAQNNTSIVESVIVKPTENELQSDALLALLGGWANNFIDGMTMGVSFGDSPIRGLTIGIAILSQQFPNEVDNLGIVMKSGVGLKRALLLNLVQAALSYLGFVIAVFIDNNLEQFDTWLYAVAAGNYLYICIGCLTPVLSAQLVASVKVSVREGFLTTILQFLTTILQFSGIIIGLVLMFLMALNGQDITTNKKL